MYLVPHFSRRKVRRAQHSVVGVYENLDQAEEAVRFLDAGQFPVKQITLVSRNEKGRGLILAGSLAIALLGVIEGVLIGVGAGGWLRQLMSWGLSGEAIRNYEQTVKAGKVLVIAHGNDEQTAQALILLTGSDPVDLNAHTYARSEREAFILCG